MSGLKQGTDFFLVIAMIALTAVFIGFVGLQIASFWPPQSIFDWLGVVFLGSISLFMIVFALWMLGASAFFKSQGAVNNARRPIVWIEVFIIISSLSLGIFRTYPAYRLQRWLDTAWTLEAWDVSSNSFQWLNVESESSYWVLADGLSEPLRIIHYQGGSQQSWQVNDASMQADHTWKVSEYPDDSPLLWSPKGTWKKVDTGWQLTPYQPSINLDIFKSSFFATGATAWMISDEKFLQIDAISGQVSEIPLPATARQTGLKPVSMRQARNGLLVILARSEQEERIYVYSPEQKWQLQDYPVPAHPTYRIIDFFLDQNHDTWLLLENQPRQAWLVQRLRPGEISSVTYLPNQLANTPILTLDQILVDSQGRLWVAGMSQERFISAFNPAWDALSIPIVSYTSNNSNYYLSSFWAGSHYLLDSGKILVLGRESIFSLESQVDTLPAPLPAWVALPFGLPLPIFGMCLGMLVIALDIFLEKRRKSQAV